MNDIPQPEEQTQDMAEEIPPCPKCQRTLISHCPGRNCMWLDCKACNRTYGPLNTIEYTQAKKEST